MTLRRKTLMLTSLTVVTLLAILTFSASTMLFGGFSDVVIRESEAKLNFVVLIIGLGLLFSLTTFVLLEKTILSRLSSLQQQLFQIGLHRDPASRVLISGQDELAALADSINQTLLALETAQNELRQSETSTRAMLDGMPDSLLRLDRNGVILDFKTGRDRAVAIPPRVFVGNTVHEALPGILAKKIFTATEKALASNETQLFEHETSFNNGQLYLEIRVTPTTSNETLTVFRDLTETRELQKSLKFSDSRDPLTGLLNRTGWEQRLSELNLTDESRVGIIAAKIDEMRLINESLGISCGDQVLTATALAIRTSLPLDSLIARIGNDEFAALLPNRTATELQQLCSSINSEIECSNLMAGALRFSLSLGYFSGTPADMSVAQLLASATDSMHRNKLNQSHAARERIFQSLQSLLSTRDFIVNQHARRLWALCQPLAKAVNLTRRRLRSLKLLSQYHDIGKVGIPDQLLFKPGPLSPAEMETMKLHVEIGHRIAQSIPDLLPIADLLLKHHEWWNGKGYPLGLAQETIPLECRIFAIVDAFDAMTNDRPDRQAFSLKTAAAELRKCAGSQFDPVLVGNFLAILGEEA